MPYYAVKQNTPNYSFTVAVFLDTDDAVGFINLPYNRELEVVEVDGFFSQIQSVVEKGV